MRYDRAYISEDREGQTVRSEFLTKKKVDHERIVMELDAIAKKADYVCRANCVNTVIGWVADGDALKKVAEGFNELKALADDLNAQAEAAGSNHRAHIAYVPVYLDVASPEAASEIARTVRDSLQAIYDALRAGDIKDSKIDGKVTKRQTYRPAMLRATGLDKLAIGVAGEAVKHALVCADEARKSIKAALDRGLSPAIAGNLADLEAIETAITWFSTAESG